MIEQLQNLLHDQKIIIRAEDKRPAGSHARQFNALTMHEVAVVIVGENAESRDIVLRRRDGKQLQCVYETHRSHDSLQYSLVFCRGEDHINMVFKMISPTTGETNKKVSSISLFAYRLTIRQDVDNHLFKHLRLFKRYCIDMYVKVEAERLNFIRFNQSILPDTYICWKPSLELHKLH